MPIPTSLSPLNLKSHVLLNSTPHLVFTRTLTLTLTLTLTRIITLIILIHHRRCHAFVVIAIVVTTASMRHASMIHLFGPPLTSPLSHFHFHHRYHCRCRRRHHHRRRQARALMLVTIVLHLHIHRQQHRLLCHLLYSLLAPTHCCQSIMLLLIIITLTIIITLATPTCLHCFICCCMRRWSLGQHAAVCLCLLTHQVMHSTHIKLAHLRLAYISSPSIHIVIVNVFMLFCPFMRQLQLPISLLLKKILHFPLLLRMHRQHQHHQQQHQTQSDNSNNSNNSSSNNSTKNKKGSSTTTNGKRKRGNNNDVNTSQRKEKTSVAASMSKHKDDDDANANDEDEQHDQEQQQQQTATIDNVNDSKCSCEPAACSNDDDDAAAAAAADALYQSLVNAHDQCCSWTPLMYAAQIQQQQHRHNVTTHQQAKQKHTLNTT